MIESLLVVFIQTVDYATGELDKVLRVRVVLKNKCWAFQVASLKL